MAKRSRDREEEFVDISSVNHASPRAKIHGRITGLSPMKKAKTCIYFDGEIADESGTMHVYGFDSSVRKKLSDHYEQNKAVVLSQCEVKPSRRMCGDLELLVDKCTEVVESNRSINVSTEQKKVYRIREVKELASFQVVTVEVKVLNVEDAVEVSGGKKKQDVSISDASGYCR